MNSFTTFFFTPYFQPNVNFYNFSPLQYCYYVDPVLNLEKSSNSTEQINVSIEPILEIQEEKKVQNIVPVVQKLNKKRNTKNASSSKKDKNFCYRNQDKDRNIYSNISKGFALRVIDNGLYVQKIEELIAKYNLKIAMEQFYTQFQKLFPAHKNYFSPSYVRGILQKEEQNHDFVLILKKILFQYLKIEFNLTLLNSNRIKRKSKLSQMEKARELQKILFE